jgi:short-subunit dehydrogenase
MTHAETALITGATAGIGAEFARQLAAAGSGLVLVARDRVRLESTASALRERYGVAVEVLAADLQSAEGVALVEERVGDASRPVDMLVNNAGYGLRRDFDENSVAEELAHLDLLVTVPLRLCHAALAQMLPRGHGTIINVASVAAFTPHGTYSAAKAWVVSFSRWAAIHYRPRGVRVTAVAPGFVRTEFHERMRVRTDTVPRALWLDAGTVVRIALRDASRGRAVSVPTLRYRALVAALRVLPDRLIARGELRDSEA